MLRHLCFSSGHSRYVFLVLFEIEDETFTVKMVFTTLKKKYNGCQSVFLKKLNFCFVVSYCFIIVLFTGNILVDVIDPN